MIQYFCKGIKIYATTPSKSLYCYCLKRIKKPLPRGGGSGLIYRAKYFYFMNLRCSVLPSAMARTM